jgi:hypothetical protein
VKRENETSKRKGSGRQGYTVTLVPEPGVDGIKALRWTLKTALRRDGLKCTDVRREEDYTHHTRGAFILPD